jgi:hypothetical protein
MVKPFSAIVLCLALAASPAVLAQDFEVVDDPHD